MNLFALAVAFLITLIAIRAFHEHAIQIGLTDAPGGRKRHTGDVPLTGGVAIFLGFSSATLLLDQSLSGYRVLYAGATLLLITGVLDDLHDISANKKILLQILAAVVMVFVAGLKVENLGNLAGFGVIGLGFMAVPFSVLAVVALINAVNMSDGMDGVAGGIVAVMLVGLVLAGVLAGIHPFPILPLLLAASVLGFLYFNFPRSSGASATVFMGDSGSMFLGFSVAWFAIEILLQSHGRIPPITIAAIVALPVFDMAILMVRRLIKGRNPMAPDREHLHHIFERAGFRKNTIASLIVGIAALIAGIGIAGWQAGLPEWVVSIVLVAVMAAQAYFVMHAWRITRVLRRVRIRRMRKYGN